MIYKALEITKAAVEKSSLLDVRILPLNELDMAEEALVLSLVNIERENALRNLPSTVKSAGTIVVKEPPVYINAYVLLSSAFPNYHASILNLSMGMEFFQNSPYINKYNFEGTGVPWDDRLEKILFEWHNLDFDKLNQVWGINGGKYLPSVMYKLRMMIIEKVTTPDEGPAITEIQFGSEIV
jgi:Pvc16 N-terminal domain